MWEDKEVGSPGCTYDGANVGTLHPQHSGGGQQLRLAGMYLLSGPSQSHTKEGPGP